MKWIITVINAFYAASESVTYLYETICEAYTTKLWVFAARNTYPVITSSAWYVSALWSDLLVTKKKPLIYSPSTSSFYQTEHCHALTLDCVTAELSSPCGKLYDMSSFFYSVKWYSNPPSIYELVLLFLLQKKICTSMEVLDTYSLTILTSDAEEVLIPLSSRLAQQPFRGFPEPESETEGSPTEGLKVD